MSNPVELSTLRDFTDVLDRLGIAYAVGGSLASSTYGAIRFTQDADVMAEPFDEHAEVLFTELQSRYYISKAAMYQALANRSSFNIIHLETAFKIDVFVIGGSPYDKQVMSRRQSTKLSDSMDKSFSVVSAEDIILLKLQWYKEGGQSSQRQWDDVLGVIRTRADALDLEYLRKWAGLLGIHDLLGKLISETDL